MHFCAGLPIILVGCKKDLRRDPRVIEELRKTSQRPVTPEEVSSLPLSLSAPLYSLCLPYDTFSTSYFLSSTSYFPPFTPHPPPHPFPPTYIQLLPSPTISFHPLYLPRWRLRSLPSSTWSCLRSPDTFITISFMQRPLILFSFPSDLATAPRTVATAYSTFTLPLTSFCLAHAPSLS